MQTYEFFLSTPRKLEEPALAELKSIQPDIEAQAAKAGVHFKATLPQALKIGLFSRIASRLYLKAFDFEFNHEKEIPRYSSVLAWNDFISPKSSIFINSLVDFEVLQAFRNTMFLNLVLKDGISDFFANKDKPAPVIEKESPKHRIFQFISKGKQKKFLSTVYFDFFGRSLSHRGYRQAGFRAPCRENVAAACLLMGEFNPQEESFLDLMCGSGTFVYEAFLLGQGISPQILHLKEKTPIDAFNINFVKKDRDTFNSMKSYVESIELHPKFKEQKIYAFDLDRKSLSAIMEFKKMMGIPGGFIEFKNADSTVEPPPSKDKLLVFANPPYAKRLGEEGDVAELYYRIGEQLKNAYKGNRALIFTGNLEMRKKIQLQTKRRLELFNGNIESRLLEYELR